MGSGSLVPAGEWWKYCSRFCIFLVRLRSNLEAIRPGSIPVAGLACGQGTTSDQIPRLSHDPIAEGLECGGVVHSASRSVRDRTLGKWIPAGIPKPPGASLLAAEGTDLVSLDGANKLSWVVAQNH